MKRNDGLYRDGKENTPDIVKFKGKSKFENKILMWFAIFEYITCHVDITALHWSCSWRSLICRILHANDSDLVLCHNVGATGQKRI